MCLYSCLKCSPSTLSYSVDNPLLLLKGRQDPLSHHCPSVHDSEIHIQELVLRHECSNACDGLLPHLPCHARTWMQQQSHIKTTVLPLPQPHDFERSICTCILCRSPQRLVYIHPGGDLCAVIGEFEDLGGAGRSVVARVWGSHTAARKSSSLPLPPFSNMMAQ